MSHGVTFWTEGGSSIGMGHLARCCNIARALKKLHVPFHFLVNNEKAVKDRLDSEGFSHLAYPLTGDNASKLAGGTVVIDTKKDLSRQVRLLKEAGKKVVLIDNSSSLEADRIIIPSPFYRGADHEGKLLGGADYLIIGENFIEEKDATREARSGGALKVLVTMGGADPFNLTEMVVDAIEKIDGIQVTVVIGPAFNPAPTLKKIIERGKSNFRFLYNVTDMAPVMNSNHMAFTANGTTVYELAYMGVPSVLIANYPEDESDLKALKELGISLPLGYFKEVTPAMIRGAVRSLMKRGTLLELMSRKASSLTDGKGAARIAKIIEMLAAENGKELFGEVRHA